MVILGTRSPGSPPGLPLLTPGEPGTQQKKPKTKKTYSTPRPLFASQNPDTAVRGRPDENGGSDGETTPAKTLTVGQDSLSGLVSGLTHGQKPNSAELRVRGFRHQALRVERSNDLRTGVPHTQSLEFLARVPRAVDHECGGAPLRVHLAQTRCLRGFRESTC